MYFYLIGLVARSHCVALRYVMGQGSVIAALLLEHVQWSRGRGEGRVESGERGGVTAEAYGSLSQSSGAPHV